MRIDTGKPWLIRRGRNWCSSNDGSSRYDGWWMFGYRIWMPRLKYFPLAFIFRIKTGENNFFYTQERREGVGILSL